ncbi:DNA repair protein [Micromonospora echinofusca]|uniref:DNA repair protein n=1 Tax=Micromonospora echinofusca TaxID=47858 RepID=UPI000C6FE295|nr:DNA repair protein [Micromonospora sp. MSM11]MCL7460767.1 DNA repair protein [Micromonospora sp. MSM11]
MPNQPNDRYHQDPERLWRCTEATGWFPAQSAYRGHRAGPEALPWSEVDKQPAGAASRGGRNIH